MIDNLGRTTIRTSSASPVIPFGKCTRWTFCCIITQEARLPFLLVMLCYGTTVQMHSHGVHSASNWQAGWCTMPTVEWTKAVDLGIIDTVVCTINDPFKIHKIILISKLWGWVKMIYVLQVSFLLSSYFYISFQEWTVFNIVKKQNL